MLIFRILRNFIVTFLIVFIIIIPISIYLVKFNNSSYPGGKLKERVLRSRKMVELFNLNTPGDARYIYSGFGSNNLNIGVFSVNSNEPGVKINEWMKEIISNTVNKDAILSETVSLNFPRTGYLDNQDLNEIRESALLSGKNDLNLIYAGSYSEKDTSVGIVLHRDTIFIFKDAIDKLSERGYIKDIIEKTTIMHEWGHLLGLDHVEDEKCIMNEQVEVLDSNSLGRNLPTKYCWKELKMIENSI